MILLFALSALKQDRASVVAELEVNSRYKPLNFQSEMGFQEMLGLLRRPSTKALRRSFEA
jgi:hypothetical protein